MPSKGIILPIWTQMRSCSFISCISVRSSVSPSFFHTFSTFKDMLLARSATDFLWVHSSRISPTPSSSIMELAVLTSPLIRETLIAVASSTGTSSFLRRMHFSPSLMKCRDWITAFALAAGAGRNILQRKWITSLLTSFSLYWFISSLPVFSGTFS